MLKFVSTKPPRLKDGHFVEGQGHGHMVGHKTSSEYNFPEQGFRYREPLQQRDMYRRMPGLPLSHDQDRNVSSSSYGQMRGLSQDKEYVYKPSERWRAYNKGYGKIGLEKEVSLPVKQTTYVTVENQPTYQYVDNRGQFDINFNPVGSDVRYLDQDDIKNANVQPYIYQGHGSGPESVPKGRAAFHSGGRGHGDQFGMVRPHSFSPDSSVNRQYRLINGSMHSPQRFSFPTPYTSGGYAPPYNLDSTGSVSLDSMSTSGDRSSKSISENMDFDTVDAATEMRQRLNLKQPLSGEHKHVHMGRGTHGLCESPSASPVRPGTSVSDSHMTSSLRRKSPSFRTGHHVRWDPDVVNSKQDSKLIYREPAKQEPHSKKKKRASLRSLLNLPRFPLSDEETTDYSSDSGLSSKVSSQSEQKVKKKKRGDLESHPEPRKEPELASLRYRTEFAKTEAPNLNKISDQIKTSGTNGAYISSSSQDVIQPGFGYSKAKVVPQRGSFDNVDFVTGLKLFDDRRETDEESKTGLKLDDKSQDMGLYVSRASEQTYDSVPYSYDLQGSDFSQHEGISKETKSISHPVMHSGFQSKPQIFQKHDGYLKPEFKQTRNINSVQPYIINGQQKDLDYDNYGREGLQTDPISVRKGSIFSSSQVSNDVSYSTEKSDTNLGQNDSVPVTFDTFVTFGGPSMSNVAFDRFATLGRPYATSTPIPNGPPSWRSDQDGYKYRKEGERSLESVSSVPFKTQVTQSWKYGTAAGPSVPIVTHAMYGSREPVAVPPSSGHGLPGHVTKPLMSHGSNVTHGQMYGQQTGPYLMQNKEYGKLSSPPTTFVTFFGGPPRDTQELTNQNQGLSHDLSETETVTSKFSDSGTFSQKDNMDYDDAMLSEVVKGLDGVKTARRKLVYQEPPVKVATSCVPQLNHELNHDQLDHSGYPRIQVVPGVTHRNGMSNMNEIIMRSPQDQGGGGGEPGDHILDLVYITERIISMSFASEEHEQTYKYNLKEVTRMLKTKHGDSYMVINISDKRADLAKHCPQVLDYGWPDHLAPPLERLCSICKAIDSWLGKDINNVVVVHCKGGRGRIAVVIAAYMRYSNICASADQALDRFAMKRFYDDKLGGLPQPSQRRYVHYFAGLLSGAIQINSSALYLHHILIHGVPNFDTKGGCRPFIKVYQGMHPIFTSGVYNVTDNMQKVCISISPGIPLRGDILIKCYHKKNKAGQREIMWGCQFHTCAISHNSLVFSKNELDGAITDPRFPDSGKVEFVFGNNSEGLVQVSDFKSDVTVPVDDSTDALTRWDSYENFTKVGEGKMETDFNANGLPNTDGPGSFRVTQLDHSQGPVDGSLYAQVNKRKLESTTVIQNGPSKLQNGGSYTSSIDSGISAFSVPMGSSTVKSNESWSYNTRDREQPSFASSYQQKQYSTTSTSPRVGKATVDEQTQLDQILSDLLNDQAFVSQKSPSGRTYSSETRSFKTVEDHISPEGNVVVQRGDVTYRMPEMKEEKHYSVKTHQTKTAEDEKSYKPVNAFTYTPQSPEMARSFEPIRSPRSPGSPRAGTLPYKVDYENKYSKSESYSQNGPGSLSDSEHSLSWLQQQQAKLREKSTERDTQRIQKEKMMIDELKSAQAQNKYFARRAQSEDEADLSYKKTSPLANGPTSPYSYTVSRTHTYSTSDKPPSDTVFRSEEIPISASHTTYIRQQIQEQADGKVSNKPPPSPSLTRQIISTVSSPAPPPQRTSSKDYMQQQQTQNRYRSNSGSAYQTQQTQSSTSNSWQTQTQSRPLQRHYSESAYDRDHFDRQTAQRSYSTTTPPISPRSVSPQTYQTYKTIYKTVHHRKEDEPDSRQPVVPQPIEVKVERQTESKQQTVQQKPSSHYITEVYVQRTGGGADSKSSTLDRKESDKRLEALEKSLQAAQASIIATQPWQQESKTEEMRRFETRTYETKQEQFHQEAVQQAQSEPPPPPKKIEVTEEDRITLKPIGPGVQQLEPEGSHTGTLGRESTSTLGRSTTPSFPTPVVSAEAYIQAVHNKARRMSLGSTSDLHATPPFPTTPKTPYQNLSVSTSPYATISSHNRLASMGSQSSATPNSVFEPATPSSVFERDYNAIVSRQLMRTNDPLYASIPEDIGGKSQESQKMQYQTFNTQQYQTQTLPHQTSQPVQQPFTTQTLPLQSSLNQQQQQIQQQQQQQQQYQMKEEKQFQSQQYHTQYNTSAQNGSTQGLHVTTDPRMLTSQQMRSPSSPGSPPSPGSNLNTLRQQLHIAHNMSGSAISPGAHSATGQSSPSVYFGMSRRGSLTSLDSEAVHTTPRFVKDTSKFWYKPRITREEAIMMLKEKAPGTFVVRDSNSFPGAFGLALKVAQIPPNVQVKSSGDPQADLVRHFLIEPTPKGVRLRGCSNEPVFGSLAALVYQHSITPLALPSKLVLPEHDPAHIVGDISSEVSSPTMEMPSSASALLAQGAACNVIFLNTVDTESLTGPQAVARACKLTFDNPPPKTTVVHFKVSNQGITLTDNQRKLFFRRHYPVAAVTYCGMDPEDRKWKRELDTGAQSEAKVFGFVARKQGGVSDNSCHLFAELDPDQPASAIVNFVTKVMIGQSKIKS